MNERLWSLSDVATYLGVSRQTVHNWVKEGRFPNAFRVASLIRIPNADIEAVKQPPIKEAS